MASGPYYPESIVYGANGRSYPGQLIGGTNSRGISGIAVQASLGANSTCYLHWQLPNPIPSGTCKLVLHVVANATTGNVSVNPTWASASPSTGENYDTITRTAETATTFAVAGTAYSWKEQKITLDADTPVASEKLVMDLVFSSAAWTLAAVAIFNIHIIWE